MVNVVVFLLIISPSSKRRLSTRGFVGGKRGEEETPQPRGVYLSFSASTKRRERVCVRDEANRARTLTRQPQLSFSSYLYEKLETTTIFSSVWICLNNHTNRANTCSFYLNRIERSTGTVELLLELYCTRYGSFCVHSRGGPLASQP